jgi:hypothetical protein
VDDLDKTLCRAWELFDEDDLDSVDAELGELLPALVDAGYVRESGHSPTGSFWAFTKPGVKRAEELGLA